ncbi:serine/threonine protein kinase [Arthrobacter sp. Edens01]|uniref:serine/threonine protein kinase n=1 Tax=Arthrobacter sp. Edens01 TaxID=1732020 RepID=UPI0006DB544E|nr:protein kinase [Arthrobacter sp. Edens01]KPN18928.1 hypothetical protein AO716_14365 [Arthrobacter sp. Edens01]
METGPGTEADAFEDAGTVRPPLLPEEAWRTGPCLGTGSGASVWLVEHIGEGQSYALKIPHAGSTLRDDYELRRELTILSRYHHENLLGVHGIVAAADGPGLLLEYAPGGSLARVVAARGALTPGQAVTVLVGVGRALQALHDEGAVHGRLTPGNVLFTANGKPLLADFGAGVILPPAHGLKAGDPGSCTAGVSTSVPGHGPSEDVYALGALGWFMLTGRPLVPGLRPPLGVLVPEAPAVLRDLLDSALREDPALRPGAGEFAAEVLGAWDPEPMDLLTAGLRRPGAGASVSLRAGSGRRRRQKQGRKPRSAGTGPARRRVAEGGHGKARMVIATLLVSATAGLGAVAVLAPEVLYPRQHAFVPASGDTVEGSALPGRSDAADERPGSGEAAGTGEPSAEEQAALAAEDPLTAVRVLSALRARAFEQGSTELLAWVNQEGSAAQAADQAQLARLEERGERLAGFGVEVLQASAAERDGPGGPPAGAARIHVSAQLSGWQQVRADGTEAAPAGSPVRQDVLLEMVRVEGQWRIAAVLPAAASLDRRGEAER